MKDGVSRRAVTVAIVTVVFMATAHGQKMVTQQGYATQEVVCVSGAYPGGGPVQGFFGTMQTTATPAWPHGGVAFDQTTGLLYSCDGFLMEPMNHPSYPQFVPASPTFAVQVPGMGPLTGMSMDPVAQIMWVTDGTQMTGVVPLPGTPVVGPTVNFQLIGVAAPPVVGLDWDPASSTWWCVDAAGTIYNFMIQVLPGQGNVALPIAQVPAPTVVPVGQPSGLALDRSSPAPRLYVSWGGAVVEYTTGAQTALGSSVQTHGIAYHGAPAQLTVPWAGAQYVCGCPGTGQAMGLTFSGPAWTGNPGFAVNVGANPFLPAFIAVDVVQQAYPFGQCWAFLNLGSPTAVVIPVTGTTTVAAPLVGVPAGQTFYVQGAMTCLGSFGTVLGYSLTPAYQVRVGLP